MHAHEQLIRHFYERFAVRDAVGMGECYADDATFCDPVFPALAGDEVRDMWSMLCKRGTDLELEARDLRAQDDVGFAQWTARYTFSATGRSIENHVKASFRFEGGRIVAHVDRFNLWRWCSQALGPAGLLLGWTPMVRARVRREANAALERYRAG